MGVFEEVDPCEGLVCENGELGKGGGKERDALSCEGGRKKSMGGRTKKIRCRPSHSRSSQLGVVNVSHTPWKKTFIRENIPSSSSSCHPHQRPTSPSAINTPLPTPPAPKTPTANFRHRTPPTSSRRNKIPPRPLRARIPAGVVEVQKSA